jgi:hypothetical protein
MNFFIFFNAWLGYLQRGSIRDGIEGCGKKKDFKKHGVTVDGMWSDMLYRNTFSMGEPG